MDKIAGCEGPYRYDAAPQTPAPKGYKPFYITHYGRHGSRYAWNAETYAIIDRVLTAAAKADALTEAGRKLYESYEAFYKEPQTNTGDLSALGWEQHNNIAMQMCQEFPEVFANGGRVLARASTAQRAIVSMSAFCTGLQKYAPKVDIEGNSLHANLVVVNSPGTPRDLVERYAGQQRTLDMSAVKDLRSKHYDAVLDRLFTNRGFLEDMGGRDKFIGELFQFWAGYQNYCEDDRFEGIFTEEELVDFWETENLSCYLSHSSRRYQNIPLLRDFVELAEEAVNGSGYVGHFRFGHDTVVNAFIPLLNINGSGFQPDKAEDVKYWFQNYNCPMAANVQFVLYRSSKNPEVLFKVLLNNQESTLPQISPVSGPYYRWSDFTAWVDTVLNEHPRMKN